MKKFISILIVIYLLFSTCTTNSYAQTSNNWYPISESAVRLIADTINRVLVERIYMSENQLEMDIENYLFEQINLSRSVHGKPPLIRNTQIDSVAKNWSQVQADYEVSTHNTNLGYDLIDADVYFLGYGENIGYGIVDDQNNRQKYFDVVSIIHNGMMAEQPPYDGHRRTILGENIDYTHIGIGVEIEGNEFWITTDYVL
ncbi:CAP domain-containing protein [Candidatus Dojkabacteria bacterium]|uniref:CAP domain-containing protein n=1 Tax=Candidatus Dojkabacteria bacterium TaxID=2099670 RepID=A0A955RKQ0_9BACT|nr:CAP domain-containing protein [Candidatus Dojkabacteria bacterium]